MYFVLSRMSVILSSFICLVKYYWDLYI